ncbi:MAG TPA: flagellar biosynthetic protein FliR [Opitutaceae bacterium]|nr:flagellar biosynthetic protein FliR [Opitutaceae bacterium]
MPAALLIAWLLIAIRGTAFLMLLPGLTGQPMPVTLRLALALTVATLLAPLVPTPTQVPATLLALIGAVGGEVLVGLMMGFVGRMAFYAAEMGGRIIATEIGLTSTPGIDAPTAANEPFASLMHRFAVVLYFGVGAHLLAVGAFARSFHFAPPGLAGLNAAAADQLVSITAKTFSVGVQLSAPFIALNFLLTFAFGLLGRTVSKVNVFMLSMGARSLAGLALLGGAGVLFARYLLSAFERLPTDMLVYLPRP